MEGYSNIKEYFLSIIERDVFSHAYLFIGAQEISRDVLIQELIQMFYCQGNNQNTLLSDSTKKPCQNCQACKNVADQIHPDIKQMRSEEGKHAISIKQIRELQSHIQQSPSVSSYTLGAIHEAHNLSTGASNALLKTLEEPSKTSILFLITHDPESVLPTIRSRSQIIHLPSAAEYSIDTNEKDFFYRLLTMSKGEVFQQLDSLFTKKKDKHIDEKEVWYQRLNNWKHILRSIYMLNLTNQSNITHGKKLDIISIQEAIDSLSSIQKKLHQNVNVRLQVEHFFLQLLK